MTTINGDNVVSQQNRTLKEALSLYISSLVQINDGNAMSLVGNLLVQTLTPNTSANYRPTLNEQMIYLTQINGLDYIRDYNWVLSNQYMSDAQITSQYYEQQTLITTVVSVLAIFFAIVATSPTISKTEEQRYLSLYFFLKVPLEKRQDFIQSCSTVQTSSQILEEEQDEEAVDSLEESSMS